MPPPKDHEMDEIRTPAGDEQGHKYETMKRETIEKDGEYTEISNLPSYKGKKQESQYVNVGRTVR